MFYKALLMSIVKMISETYLKGCAYGDRKDEKQNKSEKLRPANFWGADLFDIGESMLSCASDVIRSRSAEPQTEPNRPRRPVRRPRDP